MHSRKLESSQVLNMVNYIHMHYLIKHKERVSHLLAHPYFL